MPGLYINSLSILSPGMMGLAQALPILKGEQAWTDMAMEKIVPDLLPANERRRTTALIKIALKVAQDAMPALDQSHAVASVFASSEGDLEITDKICKALKLEDKPVSPTQFHNSVHNAAAGYWAIATRFRKPSVSLSAADASFAAGLLESASQVALDKAPVLYVAYDCPAPELLDSKRHFAFPFAAAMLLSTEKTDASFAAIQIEIGKSNDEVSCCQSDSLEARRTQNPIALSLPLLEAIVSKLDTTIYLPYLNQQTIKVAVCH